MDILLIFVLVLLHLALCIFSAFYLFLKHRNNYWTRRGVVHDPPELFYGNVRTIGQTRTYRQTFREFYQKYKNAAPFGGMYLFYRRTAIILDLELIKNILVKDFQNFPHRGVYYNEKHDPLSANLLNLEGPKWRRMRTKLTPTFSTGKIKFMFSTLVEVAERLAAVLDGKLTALEHDLSIELKALLSCYTTDVIGTCAFGIECNSLQDPETEFRVMSRRAVTAQRHSRLLYVFKQTFPDLARILGMKSVPDDAAAFFMDVVRKTVAMRESEGIRRNDFMELLIELKNNTAQGAAAAANNTDLFTIEQLAAQAYVFFLAGFENGSSTMSFCLYELALNAEIQERARNEILEMLQRHEGKITYEGVSELKYLQQVIQETMRLYTLSNSLHRVAEADYAVPDSTHVIEKGTLVVVPIDAIHHDPDIYPNPDVFDPARFAPEETRKRHPMSLLAFGEGPRNCIGQRFAEMQMLVGLVMLLSKFRFSASEFTQVPLEFNMKSWMLTAKDGIHLKVEKLD